MDLETEQKIWQRVTGEESGDSASLREMEQRCRESAAVFRRLAQSASGPAREQLAKLHQKEHENAAALRGLRILNGEEPEPIPGYAPPITNRRRALAQAYRRSLQAQADYTGASPLSPVFRPMSDAECQTQEVILALIGEEQLP